MKPARILLFVVNQRGHLAPTMRLGRTLRERGHEVIYVGSWDHPELSARDAHSQPGIGDFVRSHGFEFFPLFENLLMQQAPGVALDEIAKRHQWVNLRSNEGAVLRSWAARMVSVVRGGGEGRNLRLPMMNLLRRGTITETLRALKPDLCLIDVFANTYAFLGMRMLGVPYLRYSVLLPQGASPDVPPLDTALLHATDAGSRRAVHDSWKRLRWRRFTHPTELGIRLWAIGCAVATRTPLRPFDFTAELYPYAYNEAPLLIFCPQAFELPSAPRPLVHYVEASIDDASPSGHDDALMDWLDERKKLIVGSFGSQWKRYDRGRMMAITQGLIDFGRATPGYQVLVSAGGLADEMTEPLPDNVRVLNWIPQSALLPRTSVLVTHGGMASVKEAILHAVPMLVVPQDRDQPGNAVRVRFHGLGQSLFGAEQTRAAVQRAVGALAEPPPEMGERLARFQAAFADAEEKNLACQIIEAHYARTHRS